MSVGSLALVYHVNDCHITRFADHRVSGILAFSRLSDTALYYYYYWSPLYIRILCSRADSLRPCRIFFLLLPMVRWVFFFFFFFFNPMHTDRAIWDLHGWCHVKLPLSRHVKPCTSLQYHFIQTYIGWVRVLSCNLPLALSAEWPVTRGWNEYRNNCESAQKVDPGKEHSPAASAGTRTRDLSITSPPFKPLTPFKPLNHWHWLC